MSRIMARSDSKLVLMDIETGEIVKELGGKDQIINITDKKSIEYLHSLMVNKDNFVKVYKGGIDFDLLSKMHTNDFKVMFCLVKHIWNTNNICMYENGVILKPKHICKESGLCNQSVSRSLANLEKLGIARRYKYNGDNVIIVNPSYYMVGSQMPSWVYNMFGYDRNYIEKAYKGGGKI